MREPLACPTCGEMVTPVIKSETTRRGAICSFERDIYVCPRKRCGERIDFRPDVGDKNLPNACCYKYKCKCSRATTEPAND